MMLERPLLSLLLVTCLFALPGVAERPHEAKRQRVPAENEIAESSQSYIDVTIPTVDGMIVWKDVAASLAESMTLDAPSLERMFPTGSVDLQAPTTILVLFGIDLALGDSISIKMINDHAQRPALRFRCDRKTLGAMAPRVKQSDPVSIQIDDDWMPRTVVKPLVLCFHGLKSRPARFNEFRNFLRESGYATAAIGYGDQQSIAESAEQVDAVIKQLFVAPNQPELVLVGHSMGGLVAREWTENPGLGYPKIVSLITAGSPHGGSNWASLPPLLDLFAEGSIDSVDLVDVLLHKPSAAGMRDLAPESKFLTDLRSRPRSAGVRYTTIVGTGSPVTDIEATQLRETLQRLDQEGSMLRLIRPRIQPLLQSFDELVQGKGDGIVAVPHAMIEGVDDVVEVNLSHVDFFAPPTVGNEQPVWNVILERIRK